jgi:hypothetical protein
MNAIQGEGGVSTLMNFFLIITVCIIINVVLYLFEEKWIGGLFTGAWLFATVLSYLYNRGFDLNITNYSMTTLLKSYFLPILTYIAWIGVIYWWIIAQNDLSDNPDHSQVSRNFAVVMTFFIPVLAGIVTVFSKKYAGEGVGWAILISIGLLFLGSYSYYLNTLRDGCDKNISDSICWTYAANATFLGFIIITFCFGLLSKLDLGRSNFILKFLPINLTDPTLPINIFSIITYLIMWISIVIVFFRHDSKFGDEEGDPINKTFTAIGALMFILLLIKETPPGRPLVNMIINMIMYIFNQPLSAILLHASIITTLIVSIYFTTIYLESNGINKQTGGILALEIFLWILLIIYLTIIIYSYSKA